MSTATYDGTGADPTDFAAQDNWSGGSGTSGTPGANDDVRIGVLTKDITGNTAAWSAVNIASLKVSGGCERSLGALATPLTFGTCTSFEYAGRGQRASFSLSPTNANINVGQGREFIMAGGTWATVVGSGSGAIIKGASATVQTAKCLGPKWRDEAGPAYTTFWAMAGSLSSRCSIPTLHAAIPVLLEGAAAVSSKAWVYPGGTITNWATGTVADAEIFPRGKISYAGTPQIGATISAHTIWAGGTLQDASPGFTLTKTNPATTIGYPLTIAIQPAAAGESPATS